MNEKFKYTKVDIKDASELDPGKHFIKVGRAYWGVFSHSSGNGPAVGRTAPNRPMDGSLDANFLLWDGCEVYTREKVEPMEGQGTVLESPFHEDIVLGKGSDFKKAWLGVPAALIGQRVRWSQIMPDESV